MIGKFLSGKDHQVGQSITYGLPISLAPGPNEGKIVQADDGLPRVSDGVNWRKLVDTAEATALAEEALSSIARFIEPATQVTVGFGGDFPTINAAIAHLLQFINNVPGAVPPAEILILANEVITEQLIFTGIDLSWIILSAEDPVVLVNRAAMTEPVPFEVGMNALISITTGAAPVVNALFQFTGTGPVGVNILGMHLTNSRAVSFPISAGRPAFGFDGATRGYRIANGSVVRLAAPTITNYTGYGLSVEGGGYCALTAGNYTTTHHATALFAVRAAAGGQIGTTVTGGQTDYRMQTGVDSPKDIEVSTGGRIRLSTDTLGGVSQPINLWRARGVILRSPNTNVGAPTGTVSQTDGVPTGAIIERGSNANGEFVRFADGTQICTNGNAAITTNPAAFTGTVTNIDGDKLRVGRWF